jgi:hypothetical protein
MKALWLQLTGLPQLLAIGQAVAVLRGKNEGLGKKEDILSSAQVVDIQKVHISSQQDIFKPDEKI